MQTFSQWLNEQAYANHPSVHHWGIAVPHKNKEGYKLIRGDQHKTAGCHDDLAKEHFGMSSNAMLKKHPGSVRYLSHKEDGKRHLAMELTTHPKSTALARKLVASPEHPALGGHPHLYTVDFHDKQHKSFETDDYEDDPQKDADRKLKAASVNEEYISEAAHPVPPLNKWDKYDGTIGTGGKPTYHHTLHGQSDVLYQIRPHVDPDEHWKAKGYSAHVFDRRKPWQYPGRDGKPYQTDRKHLGDFSNASDAHKAVRAHHDGKEFVPEPKFVKRTGPEHLFNKERMEDHGSDFGFLHTKTGKAIRPKGDDETHGQLWARHQEGNNARGSQRHIHDALNHGHIRYRFQEHDEGSPHHHFEANFSMYHHGPGEPKHEKDFHERKQHIANMLKHSPYPLSSVNVDVHNPGNRDVPKSHSFENVAAAHRWLKDDK